MLFDFCFEFYSFGGSPQFEGITACVWSLSWYTEGELSATVIELQAWVQLEVLQADMEYQLGPGLRYIKGTYKDYVAID